MSYLTLLTVRTSLVLAVPLLLRWETHGSRLSVFQTTLSAQPRCSELCDRPWGQLMGTKAWLNLAFVVTLGYMVSWEPHMEKEVGA